MPMKNYTRNKLVAFFLLIIFTLYSCGKNVKYIEKEILTDKVSFKRKFCDKKLKFNLIGISILNTKQDTFLIRSHRNLGMSLDMVVFNRDSISRKISINYDDFSDSNFKNIFKINEKIDTINFYNVNEFSEHIIKPKDSFKFSLRADYLYGFERLFGEKKDYTEDMLKLLSKFELIYDDGENKICVNQNSKTEVIVYNNKSKWSWW
jgi:hypothetical protein